MTELLHTSPAENRMLKRLEKKLSLYLLKVILSPYTVNEKVGYCHSFSGRDMSHRQVQVRRLYQRLSGASERRGANQDVACKQGTRQYRFVPLYSISEFFENIGYH